MDEKISLIKLEMSYCGLVSESLKNQHFENMEIMDNLEKLSDSIDCLKILIPLNSNNYPFQNNFNSPGYTLTSKPPPPSSHKIERKLNNSNNLKSIQIENLEKKTHSSFRTNIPINSKYLTLKRNCTLISNQSSNQNTSPNSKNRDRSKSKTRFTEIKQTTSATLNASTRLNNFLENTISFSTKTTKIKPPSQINKNISTLTTNINNNKVYNSSSKFSDRTIELVRLKINSQSPESNCKNIKHCHLKFDNEKKVLNQLYLM
ncbi:unnamed protein product [Brachionus calyciflorus]|uniref:Uncharacterized protein n=1 Tax=Brachionus calyciflorus TaxID=104777 RepID=A0A814FQ48_9BILA|nr:unnamed protein product [Brachionus calyciflorus]